jgi:DUF4097 and DUF4098 domain-containing protein YvlB
MKASAKVAIVIVIIISVAIVVLQSGLLYTPIPIEQREDKTAYTPGLDVVIEASTFSGNIEIQPATGSQIEVIYTIRAPRGELYDIKTQTNESKNGTQTTLITSAQDSAHNSANHAADLLIKLPISNRYNLTLITGNGDITKPQLNDVKVAASTTNGNINIEDDDGCASIEAVSMNGNVQISLAKDTLFEVAASVGKGNIEYRGIAIDAEVQSATRLKGVTSAGEGTLELALMSANGNITIEYLS